MDEPQANRTHKASAFSLLFSNKKNLVEVYNAINGTSYPENTEVEIITLSDALFLEQLNDIAFVIDGKLVVLIEHQSTINENMPLRMLMYMGREYERITNSRDLYRENKIKIPTPEFIVLYNGRKEFPDFKEFRLSDSFEMQNGTCNLELVVKAYNINKGRNAEIAKKSPTLSGYGDFVAE
ncbi:MAG: Rpn family recombination-promoting nuclease/putative transposase, partial [Fibromonadaceae bacterium]|nr:Rpn family recombination-promoting nuclease/putative transposase [Fibromonadaceae bacterium]